MWPRRCRTTLPCFERWAAMPRRIGSTHGQSRFLPSALGEACREWAPVPEARMVAWDSTRVDPDSDMLFVCSLGPLPRGPGMASLPQNACGRLHRATTGKTRCLLVVLLHLALMPAPALAQDATWEMRMESAATAFGHGDYVDTR